MDEITQSYDTWLEDTGPAALVLREYLMPVEGRYGVLFPATFAASKDKTFKGGYNIDRFSDGTNVCLVDSVGSQANRIEPMFMRREYAGLVPQIVVKAGKIKKVNLLEAGHRAGDAIVRCSALQSRLEAGFKAVLLGNHEPLARIAPTSLVFGAWDSRETSAKLPRLIDSKIRAFDVRELKRSAQYIPAAEYVKNKLLNEPTTGKEEDAYAERGFIHVPATATHGGVIATGGVRRDATLHLAALRQLFAEDDARTLALRRYILGLALTAFTLPPSGYLRQACNLVLDPEKSCEFKIVFNSGRREDAAITHDEALNYARAVVSAFGIDADEEVEFDPELAKKDLTKNDSAEKKSKKKKE